MELLNQVDDTRTYGFRATPDDLEVIITPTEAIPVVETNLLPSSVGMRDPDKLKLFYSRSDYERLLQRLVDELNGVDHVHTYSFQTKSYHHFNMTDRLEVKGMPAEIISGREEVILDPGDAPDEIKKESAPLWDIPTPGSENVSASGEKEIIPSSVSSGGEISSHSTPSYAEQQKLLDKLNEHAEDGGFTYSLRDETADDAFVMSLLPESGGKTIDSGKQLSDQSFGGPRRQNQTSWKSVKEVSESWFRQEGGEIKARAQFLMAQIGSGEGRFEHYLNLLSESDQAAVWKEIDQKTSFRLFRDLARESGIDQKMFDQAPLQTFMFESIDPLGIQAGPSVTQLQYALVMGENPSHLMKERWKVSIGGKEVLVDPNLPMDFAEMSEVQQYFKRLNELQSKYTYDLPTDKEFWLIPTTLRKNDHQTADHSDTLELNIVRRPREE